MRPLPQMSADMPAPRPRAAFASRSPGAQAAPAVAACGGHSARLAPGRRRAFTLVEMLLALAIFAIGFAMVAAIPASATIIARRYEQIVEGEIAAANIIQQVGSRKAYAPMYEYEYSSDYPLYGAALPANAGTNKVNAYAYCADLPRPRYDTDASTGGLVVPLVFDPPSFQTPFDPNPATPSTWFGRPVSLSRTNGWQLDADTQGDFEDWMCDIKKNLDGSPSRNDNGWGSGAISLKYYGPNSPFLKLFDTNANAATWSVINLAAWAGLTYFSDVGDRTNFLKGSIFHGHNRLMPICLYPMEFLSYPSSAPLANRRIFMTLLVADQNLNSASRAWTLTAVAHARAVGDQWPEANDAQKFVNHCGPSGSGPGGLNPLNPLPNPLTTGDLSTKFPAIPGINMVPNALGLVDFWADADSSNAYTSFNYTPAHNECFTHRLLGVQNESTWDLAWVAVTPASCNALPDYPTLMHLPALIYDWDNSLIQVAYPHPYVPIPGTGQVDRRLKVGDHLVTQEGGLVLSVKSVRDETRPQYATADRAFYQIVEVYPPLREGPLGGPRQLFPMITGDGAPWPGVTPPAPNLANTSMSSGNTYPYWRLQRIYVAPAPAGGTTSSWTWSSLQTNGQFISNNPNN